MGIAERMNIMIKYEPVMSSFHQSNVNYAARTETLFETRMLYSEI